MVNTRKNKKSKRILLTLLSLVLVLCMSVAGTLAYLSSQANTVTNTFVAAGAGNVVDPTTTVPDGIKDENGDDVTTLTNGFFLLEPKATYGEGKYTLSENEWVTGNKYENISPDMEIAKRPVLTLDVATGAKVYVYVTVKNTTNANLSFTLNAQNWTKVENVTMADGSELYTYAAGSVLGADGADLNRVELLTDNKVKAAANLTLGEAGALGGLTFQAYVCQAGGFDTAKVAFETCFAEKVSSTT